MLKVVRIVLYVIIAIMVAFLIWSYFFHKQEAQQMSKYKKDLYISAINPGRQATNFTLTSQHGKRVSLSDFKGKKVLLQFMDPKCTDVCPLISQEIKQANQLLGTRSQNVAYVAVNVNAYHNKISDLQAFSKLHGLSKLNNWYFLTGSPAQLKKVWKAYGISVVPSKNGDVQHTSALFFINGKQQEVYFGQPQNNKGSVPEWAQAINFYMRKIPNAS